MSAAPDFDNATPEQIARANAAVIVNMLDEGTPRYGSAQGYACALTAIMQTDAQGIEAQRATTPESGVVHESAVGNADAPESREG